MYDKTIAGEHRIYNILIQNTPMTVYDLLSPAQKAEVEQLLSVGLVVGPGGYIGHEETRPRIRIPIDGYIIPSLEIFVRTSPAGDAELVGEGVQYTCPLYYWIFKTWVSTTASNLATTATIRIFFS